MPAWDPRANEIFLGALDRAEADREAYLATACGGDAALRQAVEALLRAHAMTAGPLDAPAPPGEEDRPGTLLAGRYKLLEPIGEGGMGTVWMAEQLEPIRRRVALKLIKPGMDSSQVIARFEAERQALALMDHPNIARVHDAGTTDTGRPFFVMELVKGVPITRYCDEQRLTPRQRLTLMAAVCRAVQHAHQKGVIHRDLKPSNVLVAAYDGEPVPKVIDFGIAKAVGQRLTERTLFTGFGAIIGTLEYMSPEQAEFNALDVDTRSDVYSLGVLLYELLTGTTPLTRQRLEKTALLEVLRLIREEDPPTPSTWLSEAKSVVAVSAQRRSEPAKLAREVRGELDWMVMKALEKDRNRRYETADALRRDLERYLHDEAVEAGPPSRLYRVRKFVARHRALVLGTTLVVLTLIVGVLGTTWGLLRALDAEGTARNESLRADTERRKALEAEATSRAFSDFLLFQVLAAARLKGQQQGQPMTVTIADAVTEAEANIAEHFKERPAAEAEVRHALGLTWRNLYRFDAAEKQFRRALELRRQYLGEDAPLTLASQRCLGATLDEGGHTPEALPILEDSLKRHRQALSPDDPDTILCLDNLAAAYVRARRVADALPLQQEAVERGSRAEKPDSLDMIRRRSNLGVTCVRLNRLTEAVPLLEQALPALKQLAGPTHRETLQCMSALGDAYTARKLWEKAIPLYEELLVLQTRGNAEDIFAPTRTRQALAINYAETGRIEDLRRIVKEYLDKQPMALPVGRNFEAEDEPLLAQVGAVLLEKHLYGPAEVYLRQSVTRRQAMMPQDPWLLGSARSLLGEALLGQGKYPEAEPLLLQGYEGLRAKNDQVPAALHQQRLREAVERLVRLYEAWDRGEAASKWREKLGELNP